MRRKWKIILCITILFVSICGNAKLVRAASFPWPIDTKYNITKDYYGYENHEGGEIWLQMQEHLFMQTLEVMLFFTRYILQLMEKIILQVMEIVYI